MGKVVSLIGCMSAVISSVLAFTQDNTSAGWGWGVAAIWALTTFINHLTIENLEERI